MSKLTESDRRLVSRYVDGELAPEQQSGFERRLLAEPALRAAVESQRAVGGWFRAGAEAEPAPACLSDRVMERIGRLPSRDGLLADGAVRDRAVVHAGRWILVAAALIFGLSMLVWGGVIRSADPHFLEAADDRIERIDAEMQRFEMPRSERRGAVMKDNPRRVQRRNGR